MTHQTEPSNLSAGDTGRAGAQAPVRGRSGRVRRQRRLLWVLVAGFAWTVTGEGARAEAPTPEPIPLGLTVTGSASLASYEAGYLYYLGLVFRLNPELVQPRVFTGASAGSINALLALMASCSPPELRVTESLLYRSWVPLGMSQLFDPRQATRISAFSRDALVASLEGVREVWGLGLDATCDATLGVSVTRVTAKSLQVTSEVKVPRSQARFVVHVQGRGGGEAPALFNYVGEGALGRPILPEEPDGQVRFRSLGNALLAATATPLAFLPKAVSYCSPGAGSGTDDGIRCPPSDAVTSFFFDGSILDGQPVRLAVQLAAQGLAPGMPARFRRRPESRLHDAPARSAFLTLDPDTEALPELAGSDPPPLDSTLPYAWYLLGHLVRSARGAELQALLDDSPEIARRLDATLTFYRPLSATLFGFFGFFDGDLRAHDFYLGMHDAAQFAAGWLPRLTGQVPFVKPEEEILSRPQAVRADWRPFLCLRAVLDGIGTLEPCAGLTPNFLAGAQVALESVYARCARVAERAVADGVPVPGTAHPACQAAIAGRGPPEVPGVEAREGWQFREGETEFDHELRRLGDHGFAFKDLGLGPGVSPRRALARQVAVVARAMGRGEVLVSSAGRTFAQSIGYVPPDHVLDVLLGQRLEVSYGWTRGEGQHSWLRPQLSLGVEGLLSLPGPAPGRYLTLLPMVGVEFEAVPLSSSLLQWRGGVRAGFQFSSADDFTRVGCEGQLPCSRVVTEVYLAGTLLQWARLQVGVELLPPMRGLPFDARFKPSLGVEVDWP